MCMPEGEWCSFFAVRFGTATIPTMSIPPVDPTTDSAGVLNRVFGEVGMSQGCSGTYDTSHRASIPRSCGSPVVG
jgi:hypothetical protein